MKRKITQGFVNRVKPTERPYDVNDTQLSGFILRILPSGKGSYYVAYRRESGKRTRFKLGDTEILSAAQAREAAKEFKANLQLGEDLGSKRRRQKEHTLSSFLKVVYEPWIVEHRKGGRAIAAAIKSGFPCFLETRLTDITAWGVEKWRSDRKKAGNKPGTTNRYITYLAAMMKRAVEWEFIESTPMPKVKKEREDASRARYLESEEELRLFDALDDREERIRAERDSANGWRRKREHPEFPNLRALTFADYLKPMIVVSLNTGLRRGELFLLQWSNIDIDGATLTVPAENSKSGKARHVTLCKTVCAALEAWRRQTSEAGLVFKSPKTGLAFRNVTVSWQEVRKDAKLEDFRWHDMRHDFASKLVMKGIGLYVVKELLGHSSITMTERYAHLAPSAMHEAVAVLDERPSSVVLLNEKQQVG